MRLPTIQGIIRRRILANFSVDPAVIQRHLPSRFRPKLHEGSAVAGICMIRLESIRPKLLPKSIGLNSENAAHRTAVLWDDNGNIKEGVFISRRDTSSQLNHLVGGRIFPGEHHQATFDVSESPLAIEIAMASADGEARIELQAEVANEMPNTSIFSALEQASAFFRGGSLGYSVTSDRDRLDGLTLHTEEWRVEPLKVHKIYSSYFFDETKFPKGSIRFDHALLMRNVAHEWRMAEDLYI